MNVIDVPIAWLDNAPTTLAVLMIFGGGLIAWLKMRPSVESIRNQRSDSLEDRLLKRVDKLELDLATQIRDCAESLAQEHRAAAEREAVLRREFAEHEAQMRRDFVEREAELRREFENERREDREMIAGLQRQFIHFQRAHAGALDLSAIDLPEMEVDKMAEGNAPYGQPTGDPDQDLIDTLSGKGNGK